MAAAAPLAMTALSSAWAAPAIGAAAGALMNKDNRLQGAMLGGLGGAFAGPALGALKGASGVAAATGAGSAPWATSAQGLLAQEAGLGQLGSMGWKGAATGLQGALNSAAPVSGLLNNPMTKIGMNMMQGGQQPQMQPQMPPPQRMNPTPQQGSMAELGMRGQPYQMARSGRF